HNLEFQLGQLGQLHFGNNYPRLRYYYTHMFLASHFPVDASDRMVSSGLPNDSGAKAVLGTSQASRSETSNQLGHCRVCCRRSGGAADEKLTLWMFGTDSSRGPGPDTNPSATRAMSNLSQR